MLGSYLVDNDTVSCLFERYFKSYFMVLTLNKNNNLILLWLHFRHKWNMTTMLQHYAKIHLQRDTVTSFADIYAR